ncbi:MAG: hypothetical protein MJK18_07755 [Bdellovibrionales bacterium]|nr:hypothetical protein [Bdellovibrionales bacterium]
MLDVKSILTFILILFSVDVFASPEGFLYQGQIIKPSGQQLEDDSVLFTMQLYSPGVEECLLYEETHTLNLVGSKGLFTIPVGDGVRSGSNFEDSSTLSQVFNNNSGAITPTTCDSVGSYTPGPNDSRLLRVTFDDGSGPITVSNDHRIMSTPFAQQAYRLEGLGSSDFIQVNNGAGQELNQANMDTLFTTANHTELMALINGTSSQYLSGSPTSAFDVNNQRISNVAAPTSGTDATNRDYVDNNIAGLGTDNATLSGLGAGQSGFVLSWNGSEWTATAAPLDLTKHPLSGGTMTGNLNMGNQDITNVNSITVTGGIGVGTGLNSSGPISITQENELRLEDDDGTANYVGFKAANSLTGNQVWTLPTADGNNGEVLSTNGSGALSWIPTFQA